MLSSYGVALTPSTVVFSKVDTDVNTNRGSA
jgi:hypothetical protein